MERIRTHYRLVPRMEVCHDEYELFTTPNSGIAAGDGLRHPPRSAAERPGSRGGGPLHDRAVPRGGHARRRGRLGGRIETELDRVRPRVAARPGPRAEGAPGDRGRNRRTAAELAPRMHRWIRLGAGVE